MGLIDLKTDLKSLGYGKDQRGGGSSNQPYIVTTIPDGYYPKSPDFLLRNGYLNPINSLNDVSRLTKWLGDTKSPNGILFTAKQQLLERQNVPIPGGFNRVYNPAGTLAQAGVLSTGYHLNKQGLDPFAKGYFNDGENGYYQFNIPKPDNNNGEGSERLKALYAIKQIGRGSEIYSNAVNSGLSSQYNISLDPNIIISYSSGPNSVLGIGNTNIRFTSGLERRERTNNLKVLEDAESLFANSGNLANIQDILTQEPQLERLGTTVLSALNPFYNRNIKQFNREDAYLTGVTEYKPQIKLTNPNKSYENRVDIQNYLEPQQNNNSAYDDLVKFYFELIDNDGGKNNFLFFRAYINNIGDGFKADWQAYKYVGRAENFYKYNGFSRDMSLSFVIYAHTREEMIPIYTKLNKLVGITAPSYSTVGLMRGNFIRMTVGDYLDNMPAIVQNISLKPSFDAGWDINREENGTPIKPGSEDYVGQLPRLIEVDISFTPIHNFTPTNQNIYIGNEGI